ncbi:MAG: acetyl esterase/lipase [Crocinitomix sp.]|jgi:acetyl esterase/lipase
MKSTQLIGAFALLLLFSFSSCKKKGCTDPVAINYNENATQEDGSCEYEPSLPTIIQRISYGIDDRQHFDLYIPGVHDENTKTVLLVHGGAWVLGPLPADSVFFFGPAHLDLTNKLLIEGYAVAVMKYRLACYTEDPLALSGDPNFYMDDMIEDLDLAIAKLKSEAATLEISPDNFALIGESAGAHIALMYSLQTTDTAVKTVVSFFGPTLMDEEVFKTNASSPPYNNFSVNSFFALRDAAEGCDMRVSGSANLSWGINSFAGTELEVCSVNSAFSDALSPAHPSNLTRNLPVFLMHGLSDDLVPHGHGDSLMAALNTEFATSPAAINDFSAQHKLLKYENCGHGWSGGGCNKSAIRQDVVQWLAAHF